MNILQQKNKLSAVETIQRIHQPEVGSFEKNFLSRHQPVIITGEIEHWQSLSKWNASYLNAVVGDKQVDINVSKTGIFINEMENYFSMVTKKMQFQEFMNLIMQKNELIDEYYYLRQQSITTIFPELAQDIDAPKYFNKKLLLFSNIWIGSGGNISPLHFDTLNNFLVQVTGRKKVLLFNPQQTSLLYPFPIQVKRPHLSQVNIDNPNLQKFPKFTKAKFLECILEAGEILFIPLMWWHQVYSLDQLNISVNFWWKAKFQEYLTQSSARQFPVIAKQCLRKIFMHIKSIKKEELTTRG
jgi:hypothetical protein